MVTIERGNYLSERYDFVTSSIVQQVKTLLQEPRATGVFSMWHDQVQPIRAKLNTFAAYREGWDSYRAKPFENQTLRNASSALDDLVLKSLIPYRVSASGDGSIIFECAVNNGKLVVEVAADNQIGIVWKKNGETQLCDTDVEGLLDALSLVEHVCL